MSFTSIEIKSIKTVIFYSLNKLFVCLLDYYILDFLDNCLHYNLLLNSKLGRGLVRLHNYINLIHYWLYTFLLCFQVLKNSGLIIRREFSFQQNHYRILIYLLEFFRIAYLYVVLVRPRLITQRLSDPL